MENQILPFADKIVYLSCTNGIKKYKDQNSYNMKIPGVSFSWKRALGITQVKRDIARKTGIPTSKAGLERKIGNAIIKTIFGKK